MNVDFLRKAHRRRFFVFLLLLFLCVVVMGLSGHFISKKINENQDEMVAKIQKELGFPVTFQDIKTSWFGPFLRIDLEDITVYDSEAPIAFIKMDSLKLYPDLFSLLFKKEPQFNKLAIDGIKWVASWNKKTGFSMLGLKGESIATTIDYTTLISLLSKHKLIMIKNGEMQWQVSNTLIKQAWGGTFHWLDPNAQAWMLKGEQELFLKEEVILPHVKFSVNGTTDLKTFKVSVEENKFSAECHFRLPDTHAWQTTCEGNINDVSIDGIPSFYKKVATEHALLKWLLHAIPKGKLTQGIFKIEGPLKGLQGEGQLAFKDVLFQYMPDWPAIYKASGALEFNKENVQVTLNQGKIMDSSIEKAFAKIAPLGSHTKPIVAVEGKISSKLQKGLLFLQNTPLRKSIASPLEALEPQGNLDLALKLAIPLEEEIPVRVEGKLTTKEGEVKIPGTALSLKQLTGTLEFTEQAIKRSDLKGFLDRKPLHIKVNTSLLAKQKILNVKTTGFFESAFLQQHFKLPGLEKLSGEAEFTIDLKKPLTSQLSGTEWMIASDLYGIGIDLPSPFGKTAKTYRKLAVTVATESPKIQKVSLQVEKIVDAKMIFQSFNEAYQLKQGHIVLGDEQANWLEKESLVIDGTINQLKVVDWLDSSSVLSSHSEWMKAKSDISVWINHLDVYGMPFKKVWLKSEYGPTGMSWLVEGESIKGSVSFPSNQQELISVNLDYLKLWKENALTKSKLKFLSSDTKFSLLFHCKNFQYEQAHFGEVFFKLLPQVYGYQIEDLSFETKDSELVGKGEWHLSNNAVSTTLTGEMKGTNMGKTFLEWGYPSAILESSGYIKYQLMWPGHPFEFDVDRVEGTAQLKLDKGRIVGINPGLGRVIGLLNLESIKRRLQLDFSDVVKKGFVFDAMNGEFNFQEGIATTQALMIDSPSAKIKLEGEFNLKSKTVDLNMRVTPHVNVGIPIAAAIAGGPAIGAGVWILDKLTGSRINRITQHLYQVTGTWDAPTIHDLSETARKQKASSP